MAAVTNLLTQVANLAGTATDADAVETWLLDGARQVSKYGKMAGKIGEFTKITASFLNGSTTTASVDDIGEIIKVTRGGDSQVVKICRYIDQNEFVRSADATSIYYENSTHSPVYTFKSNGSLSMLTVSPTPANTDGLVDIEFIPDYAINGTDNDIHHFPKKYYHLCIYYASIKELGRKLKDSTITLPSIPVGPAGPSFTYTDASVIDLIHPLISTSLLDAQPSVLSITTSLPVAPAMSEKSVSITGTAPTYTAPVAPTYSIAAFPTLITSFPSAPVGPTVDLNTVTGFGTAPSYTAPVFSVDSAPTITDLDIAAVPPPPPVSSSISGETLGAISISELPLAPTFIAPVMSSLDFGGTTGTEFWITTEEDPEMLSARVQEIQSKIGEYSAKLGEAQAQFTKESTVYQAGVQKNLEQARIDMQDEHKEGDMAFQASMQNYTNDLQKYSAELQSYQAQVGKEVQEWQLNYEADMAAWNQENSLNLQKYQADMQNNLNVFNDSNVEYQAAIQKNIQEAQLAESQDGRKLQKYQTDIQAYSADVGALIQQNQDEVSAWQSEHSVGTQKYQIDLSKYQAEMQSALNQFNEESAEYQALLQTDLQDAQLKESKEGRDLQKYSQELQAYTSNVGTEVQEYSQNFARWQADAANDLQIAVQNVQAELTAKQANMSKDAQINLQNAVNNFQTSVQEYQSELAKYQAEIGKYQSELGANAQKYQAEVAGLQIKLQQCQAMYQEAIQLEFQVSLQADVLDKQGA